MTTGHFIMIGFLVFGIIVAVFNSSYIQNKLDKK